ncbi:hypothetical protein QR680_008010 [Steinernema hermaphroditum]|uniref:Uncharacterized protein n=1 Tax=Steinernema hermaphroditum TaxID=289476 RepID=A0AA39IEZ4_9BILA|nr:hypothetical protein QR680_008010 [Steinernema hermaphroditum]
MNEEVSKSPTEEHETDDAETLRKQREELKELHERLEAEAREFEQIHEDYFAYQQNVLKMELQAAEALDRAVQAAMYGKFIDIIENAFNGLNNDVVSREAEPAEEYPSCYEEEVGTPPYSPQLPLLDVEDLEDDDFDSTFISPADNPLFYEMGPETLPHIPVRSNPWKRSRSC